MASLFKRRRGWRAASSPASPGHLAEEPAAQSGDGDGWLSSLVSGAGKLVSAVLGPDSAPSSSSSFYSSEEGTDSNSSEEEDTIRACEGHKLSKKTKTSKMVNDWLEGSISIITEIEAKSAIEQLLLRETFTRDECNKLTKIIQSRVIDVQSAENDHHCVPKELPHMAAREAFACPQACQSLHQSGDIPKTIRSPSILNCHSPGPSTSPAVQFNFHDSVVIGARKGLELKRTPSCLKASLDHGLCTLNTDMLHYVLKRDYSTFTPRDTFDEVRRVRLKSKENMLAGASTKILGINHSSTLTEALHAEDDSASRTLRQSDARALELVKPIAVNNAPSPNINALDTEAALDIELTHTLKQTALPPETTPSRVAYDSRLSVPVSLPDEKKAHFSHPVLYQFFNDIEETSATMEQLENMSESHALASTGLENKGEHKENIHCSLQPAILDEASNVSKEINQLRLLLKFMLLDMARHL
ncbi:unnamed protein product [Musa acuminata subsp. malaccensis]|uniref:(wild Malaysian banana) hypothetical protein n=1 Tax=Musa acuminata subsp. malaccensis TaxID=214687 RepID=A0A804HME9_MUSAM|nr:unnamed protein product [Musa acuminata subsp. malaccensis]